MDLDSFDLVKNEFIKFGYKVLDKPDLNDINCDMYVVGHKKCLKVEIKNVVEKKNGTWQSDYISDNQKKCDVVAAVFPSGYVFIESMEDYLKLSSENGYRQFTWLKL